jgi:hypothetical protein
VEELLACLFIVVPAMALAMVITFLLCEARLTTVRTTVLVLERQMKEARTVREDEEKILREIFSTLLALQMSTEQMLLHMKDELGKLTGQMRFNGTVVQVGHSPSYGNAEGRLK